MIKAVLIVVLLLCAAITDIRKRKIPDVIPWLILGVGLIDLHFVDSLLGIALTGLPCFLIALITSRENKLSIGGGDIKLISACAIAFGSVSISVLQNVVAMILAILYGFVTKKKSKDEGLALAPFILIGGLVALTLSLIEG